MMEARDSSISLVNLAAEVRTLYESDPARGESAIESLLEQRLKSSPPAERIALLKKLTDQFRDGIPKVNRGQYSVSGDLSRLLSLLFGKKVSMPDISSEEFLEKLAHSLNTTFDSLNQIISVIHTTLLGKKDELETIRMIIGSDMGAEGQPDSLQKYLDQVKEAFLVAHRAFWQATKAKVSQILSELDPERIAAMAEGGLEFGPLRKAKLFEVYKEQFLKCQGWFASGRLMEELLREFEKNCQNSYRGFQGGEYEKV